ncbi:hypothetical protein QE152_g10588 [Popillia japonica]|uniref:Uncharacterized protein n=1 Tax=Popillia japonica TaxID=7064 RepID=A0AAW1LU93_POPJA
MQCKCLLILTLAAIVQSASISKSIPVKVLYEKEYVHKNYIRNLNEKVQLSTEQLRQIESRSAIVEESSNSNQQILNELKVAESEAVENVADNAEENVKPLLEDSERSLDGIANDKEIYVSALRNHNEKVQLPSEKLNEASKYLPANDNDVGSLRSVPTEAIDDSKDFYQKVKDAVNTGIHNLKQKAKKLQLSTYITSETWTRLDTEAEKFLEAIELKYSLRQSNQNVFEQFQQFANNFLASLSGSNSGSPSNDEAQPGFPQNIVNFFTGGLQQIQANLPGQNQQSTTVQHDPDVSTKPPSNQNNNNNPFQGFVSSVQNAFTQFNPFNQGQGEKPSTQGEESTQPSGPFQSIQSTFSQIGAAINNYNPFNQQTQKPETQGDDVTTPGPFQVIQGLATQAGQVFNQLNPFQQSTTKAPSADPTTKNPIQSAAENFGSQISEGISGIAAGNNPISGIAEGAASQLGSLAGNNPLQGGGNPLEAAQGAAQQVASAVASGNPLQGGGNPLDAAQGVAQQVAGAVASGNPLQGGGNPLQAAQGVAQQVSGAVAGGNPFGGENNPLGAAQGVVEQVGSALTSGNPLAGSSSKEASESTSDKADDKYGAKKERSQPEQIEKTS